MWTFLAVCTLLAIVLSVAYGRWVDHRAQVDAAHEADLRREARNVRGEE